MLSSESTDVLRTIGSLFGFNNFRYKKRLFKMYVDAKYAVTLLATVWLMEFRFFGTSFQNSTNVSTLLNLLQFNILLQDN